MSPFGVLLDFKEALAKGFTNVFPNTHVFGDFFHMIQANVKHIGQLGLKSLVKFIVRGLRTLWHAATKEEFDREVKTFLEELDRRAPRYTEYFRKNWLERYAPEKWASFGRPKDAPSGN